MSLLDDVRIVSQTESRVLVGSSEDSNSELVRAVSIVNTKCLLLLSLLIRIYVFRLVHINLDEPPPSPDSHRRPAERERKRDRAEYDGRRSDELKGP